MELANFRELVTHVRSHEQYQKLYAKPQQSFKRARISVNHTSPGKKKSANGSGRIFGLDCEMVITTKNKTDKEYSLARASLVEFVPETEEFYTRFDVFVKVPDDRVVQDLLEHVSGVTTESLETATHSLDDVTALLDEHVQTHDIVVGHSLWSDFEALKWWHDNFVDTSLFFKVRTAPRMTLGLKDAVIHVSGEVFQAEGAHDPVIDAKYAIKVAKYLAQQSNTPFIELDDVPARFKKLLTVHNLDVTRKNLQDVLQDIAHRYGATIPKPMKISSRDGAEYGSITFEFPDEAAATESLRKFPANAATSHVNGFPDQAGFIKKFVKFEFDPPLCAEVISYHRPALDGEIDWICPKRDIGKILGQRGERVLRISRLCGAQISNAPKDQKSVVFTIRAPERQQCEEALKMLKDHDSQTTS